MPPGADEPIDFAFMNRTSAGGAADPMTLAVNPVPIDARHVLTSLRLEVGLTVTARNANPTHYNAVVRCDGQWGDDPWDHFALETLTLVRTRR